MRTPFLFVDVSIFDVLQHQQTLLKNEIERLDATMIEQVHEEEIIRELASRYKMDVPVLIEDSAYTSHREVDVDVSHDPMRVIFDESQPFFVRGTEITISVPFKGNADFLRIRPTTFTLNPPRADVHEQELRFVYTRTDSNAAAAAMRSSRMLSSSTANSWNTKKATNSSLGGKKTTTFIYSWPGL